MACASLRAGAVSGRLGWQLFSTSAQLSGQNFNGPLAANLASGGQLGGECFKLGLLLGGNGYHGNQVERLHVLYYKTCSILSIG